MQDCKPELVIFKSKYYASRQYDLLTNLQQTIGIIRITTIKGFEKDVVSNNTYPFAKAQLIFDKIIQSLK